MRAIISLRAYTSIVCETYEKISTETGGIFLGFFDNNVWYVIEGIDPGPRSIFTPSYFEYDQGYVSHLSNKIARYYSRNIGLVGLWHRHPGGFDSFSRTDDGTNQKYASQNNFGAISGIVNIDPDFRLTIYHVENNNPISYSKIPFEVGDNLIPKHMLQLQSANEIIAKYAKVIGGPDNIHGDSFISEISANKSRLTNSKKRSHSPQNHSTSRVRENPVDTRIHSNIKYTEDVYKTSKPDHTPNNFGFLSAISAFVFGTHISHDTTNYHVSDNIP
jgi:hypothetical protein